jgi:RNA polymerase sigma-70 factor (ECF subfamily)
VSPYSLSDSGGADNPSRLIKEARDGSREALGRLLELYRPDLLKNADAQLVDLESKADGSDLVQQTFLEAWQSIHRFEGTTEAEIVAWLRGILDCNVVDFRRRLRDTDKRQISREVPLNATDSESGHFGGLMSRESSPSSRVSSVEQEEALELAMTRLPEVYRQLIDLHNRQHLTFMEIAHKIDRSPEAVRKLWTRAIEDLQRELGLS